MAGGGIPRKSVAHALARRASLLRLGGGLWPNITARCGWKTSLPSSMPAVASASSILNETARLFVRAANRPVSPSVRRIALWKKVSATSGNLSFSSDDRALECDHFAIQDQLAIDDQRFRQRRLNVPALAAAKLHDGMRSGRSDQ